MPGNLGILPKSIYLIGPPSYTGWDKPVVAVGRSIVLVACMLSWRKRRDKEVEMAADRGGLRMLLGPARNRNGGKQQRERQ